MKIMVVGGGGREHAIIKKLKENKEITEIFALPGNGGMAEDATVISIGAKEIDKIVDFVKDILSDCQDYYQNSGRGNLWTFTHKGFVF